MVKQPDLGSALLATKLRAPRPAGPLVRRPRLTARLEDALARRLVLVSAPAGFGKTTLLVQWLLEAGGDSLAAEAAAGRPGFKIGWLTLDGGDQEPARFLSYLIAALQTVTPHVGEEPAALLRAPERVSPEAVLTLLINDLVVLDEPLVLVLDDYQAIDSPRVHGAVAFLVDGLPEHIHLVLGTRTDPPLPLARWRARGQLAEVRADDLRFTQEETAAVLNGAMRLGLAPEDVASLETRTEGWIVGLHMAALSLQGRPAAEAAAFVRAFSGTNRYILDYLTEEVLARQPEGTQSFLLQTSILARLTAPLCDAVTEREGGQAMLEGLERANLFVSALDDERRWFRYHPLFADLIHARLQQSEPEMLREVHGRAAGWYEENGLPAEAIRHAMAARDIERAAGLIERNALPTMVHGELGRVAGWLNSLPADVVARRPWLGIYQAATLGLAGQFEQATLILDAVEQQISAGEPGPMARAMLGFVLTMRASWVGMQGNAPHAIELALRARDLLSEHDLLNLNTVVNTLGYAYYQEGDLARSAVAWMEAARLSELSDNVYNRALAAVQLAKIRRVEGRLHQAVDLYRDALEKGLARGGKQFFGIGNLYIGLADVAREWNDLAAAREQAAEGNRQNERYGIPTPLVAGYTVLSRVLWADDDLEGALALAERAVHLAETQGVVPDVAAAADNWRVRLWLAAGDLPAATHWLDERRVRDAPLAFVRELDHLTLARVLLAQDRPGQAAAWLERLAEAAEAGGRTGRLIEILALKAAAHHAEGRTAQALATLGKSLGLGAVEGYVRLFFDEGQPLLELLRLGIARDSWPTPAAAHARRLLAAVSGVGGRPSEQVLPAKPPPAVDLPEPLTDREIEVLRLIAAGYSNQEIAAQLTVTLHTAKKHASNILGKLGVTNRTQAVARARELHLL